MSIHTKLKMKTRSALVSAATILGLSSCIDPKLSEQEISSLYSQALSPPEKPLNVYYLGHSLVGRDIPAMVQQLAESGHDYRVQLGWGTTLRAHLDPDHEIAGFEKENNHSKFRGLEDALSANNYDAFVFTEMVEITDAFKYFESVKYTTKLINSIHESNPDTRIYLYETWHEVTDPKGWTKRLDHDLEAYWLGEILDKALARTKLKKPVYVIPAGQALAAFFKELEKRGSTPDISKPEDIFARTDTGELDPIHINDLGAYFVALVHYATLYQQSPVGKPHKLLKATGEPATPPSEETAALMQEIVWQVVSNFPRSGIQQ